MMNENAGQSAVGIPRSRDGVRLDGLPMGHRGGRLPAAAGSLPVGPGTRRRPALAGQWRATEENED